MAISRSEKEQRIEALTCELGEMSGAVFTDYRGLTVRELEDLRGRLRDAGAHYRVVKYTLLSRALGDAGLEVSLEPVEGPLGMAYGSGDITALAKAVMGFAKENEKLDVTGGIVDRSWADRASIQALSTLPSREELYAKVVGSLNAPLSGLVGVLSNVPRGLVSVLSQYAESKGA